MYTSSPERIAQLTDLGFWGSDTLHSLLAQRAAETPDRLAVADQPNRAELATGQALRLSFKQLDQASDAYAATLLASGVGAGDRVLVQLPNISELVVCYFALSKLGAVISPVPVQYGAHELRALAQAIDPRVAIGIEQFRSTPLAANMASAMPELTVLSVGTDLTLNSREADRLHLNRHRELCGSDANRIISICWTSGTTGTPKGVPRSHNMWLATARNTIEAASYEAQEVMLNPFPLVNMAAIAGFLYPCVMLGNSIVLHHPIDPPLYLKQIETERVNFTIAPPPLLNQLAKSPELWAQFDFSELRALGSGSAPLAPSMIATFEADYGKPIINFYGSNEGISLFSTPETAAQPEVRAALFPRFGAEGMPWTGDAHESVRSKVIAVDSGELIDSAGQPGELCISGATVFDGYLGGSNGEVFTDDGFFRTGDLVEICGQPPHYYRIVGRCKDIINRGGMKISPSELDILLEGFPGLAEVAVCAYPDASLGEKVCACVVPDPDSAPPTLKALANYLRDKGVASFKLPQRLVVLDCLPRNPMGKVLRSVLQESQTEQENSA